MHKRHLIALAALATLLAAGLSCLPNPEGPTLEPPGSALLYFANYNSIQMNGDFMPGELDGWDAEDPRHEMVLVADNEWQLVAFVAEAELTENPPIILFKFTHDKVWLPDRWNATSTPGLAELSEENGPNILLSITTGPGFYTFTFNDETFRYSTHPAKATGGFAGTISYDGEEPDSAVTLTLTALHPEGDMELFSLETSDETFAFGALADSLYALRASCRGYDSWEDTLRVENGVAPVQAILLTQVFGAISGTVTFSDSPAVPPEAIVVAYEHGTENEAGRDSTDAAGDYKVEGLSTGAFDLRFSALGYISATADGVYVAGDVEVTGVDVTLDPTPAATPDQPWHTRTIDGALDAGWTADLTDPPGDSNWGASNDFHGLHVDWDADRLYVAVSGSFDNGGNTVNIYVDKDYGAGTGLTDFSGISGGSVGDHLRKTIDMSGVAGYGADFAGSVWATIHQPEVTDITDPVSIFSLDGQTLTASTSCVEFSVPWASLYPDLEGRVPPLVELAFYCVIGGGEPQYLADDTLPAVGDPHAPDAVFVIQVDTDER